MLELQTSFALETPKEIPKMNFTTPKEWNNPKIQIVEDKGSSITWVHLKGKVQKLTIGQIEQLIQITQQSIEQQLPQGVEMMPWAPGAVVK